MIQYLKNEVNYIGGVRCSSLGFNLKKKNILITIYFVFLLQMQIRRFNNIFFTGSLKHKIKSMFDV